MGDFPKDQNAAKKLWLQAAFRMILVSVASYAFGKDFQMFQIWA